MPSNERMISSSFAIPAADEITAIIRRNGVVKHWQDGRLVAVAHDPQHRNVDSNQLITRQEIRETRSIAPVRQRIITQESYDATYDGTYGSYSYRADPPRLGQATGTQRGYQVGDIVRYISPNADYFDQLFEVATQFTQYVHARALTADGYLRDEIHQFYNTAIKLEEAVDASK